MLEIDLPSLLIGVAVGFLIPIIPLVAYHFGKIKERRDNRYIPPSK